MNIEEEIQDQEKAKEEIREKRISCNQNTEDFYKFNQRAFNVASQDLSHF